MHDLYPIAEKIREADAILIGASNGLSITEGLHLFADNRAFEELFGDTEYWLQNLQDAFYDEYIRILSRMCDFIVEGE